MATVTKTEKLHNLICYYILFSKTVHLKTAMSK